ncbi:MAG: diguanylate cyclase [Thauera phenolivorans]|uniref:diguanylate cyclase n=1 Tax=Thauera phenolivorans TaxID=1792543 RepID=A0A7X7LYH7_9RHOO|nr:diguanylate cyclase [Thauera phenolivorans]
MKSARLSLRTRLLLTVLLPVSLLLAVVAGVSVVRGDRMTASAIAERGLAIVSFLAPAAEYGVISGNAGILGDVLAALRAQKDVVAATLYDREGNVLAQGGSPRLLDAAAVLAARAPVHLHRGAGRTGFAAPVLSLPLVVDAFAASAAAPEPQPVGWVYVEIDTSAREAERRTVLFATIAAALGVLVLTAGLAVRLADSVAEPVARLVEAVRRMAAGELGVQVPDRAGSEELRELQRGFNTMARAITDAHQTMQARIDEATAQLAHQAMHDALTGLPNRRAFERALEDAVAHSRRAGGRSALCFIDLDHFKEVNDSAGHAAGDALLRAVAELIGSRLRTDDLVCRIGGDEFALILRGCSREDARRIAESVCEAVAGLRFAWEGREFRIGASIGFATIDTGVASVADVLHKADHACYVVKRAGRGRVSEFEADADGGAAALPPG